MTDARIIEAAEWVERLRDAGPAERRRFEVWREQPENAAAWSKVAVARNAAAALADAPGLLGLRHAAVARSLLHRPRRRWPAWAAVGSAVAATLAIVTFTSPLLNRPTSNTQASAPVFPVYRTEAGQRLVVALQDGSRLTLNTNSVVRVAYNATERRLVLDRGQALFDVAKHQSRPFIVTVGDREVVAHGTQFDVRRGSNATQVALIEGKISVVDKRHGDKPVMLAPDDILTASSSGIAIRHDPGSALALASWSEGRVEFTNAPLSTALAEMNRYLPHPMTAADDRAAGLRVSGAFRTGETEPFLAALKSGFPVRVQHQADGSIRISSYRSK